MRKLLIQTRPDRESGRTDHLHPDEVNRAGSNSIAVGERGRLEGEMAHSFQALIPASSPTAIEVTRFSNSHSTWPAHWRRVEERFAD